jgi:predicted ATPase
MRKSSHTRGRSFDLADNIHLRAVTLAPGAQPRDGFPFNVPIIRMLTALEFVSPVTILVGENGCGKSTLLEALAGAAGSITVGSESVETDRTLASIQPLVASLRLTWAKRTHRGFFMRSEDFFGFAKHINATKEELERELRNVDEEYRDKSPTARAYARSAYAGELAALRQTYGENLDARSHGESYLKLFQARFVPEGLYLLDEPEAPLSPTRQLAFMAMLKSMVDQQGQFIIATHSPIIMAYPGATILSLDGGQIRPVRYDDLEHVAITRSFLNDPSAYLHHLFAGAGQ